MARQILENEYFSSFSVYGEYVCISQPRVCRLEIVELPLLRVVTIIKLPDIKCWSTQALSATVILLAAESGLYLLDISSFIDTAKLTVNGANIPMQNASPQQCTKIAEGRFGRGLWVGGTNVMALVCESKKILQLKFPIEFIRGVKPRVLSTEQLIKEELDVKSCKYDFDVLDTFVCFNTNVYVAYWGADTVCKYDKNTGHVMKEAKISYPTLTPYSTEKTIFCCDRKNGILTLDSESLAESGKAVKFDLNEHWRLQFALRVNNDYLICVESLLENSRLRRSSGQLPSRDQNQNPREEPLEYIDNQAHKSGDDQPEPCHETQTDNKDRANQHTTDIEISAQQRGEDQREPGINVAKICRNHIYINQISRNKFNINQEPGHRQSHIPETDQHRPNIQEPCQHQPDIQELSQEDYRQLQADIDDPDGLQTYTKKTTEAQQDMARPYHPLKGNTTGESENPRNLLIFEDTNEQPEQSHISNEEGVFGYTEVNNPSTIERTDEARTVVPYLTEEHLSRVEPSVLNLGRLMASVNTDVRPRVVDSDDYTDLEEAVVYAVPEVPMRYVRGSAVDDYLTSVESLDLGLN